VLFYRDALAFWDALLDEGAHVAAIGGSDDHRAGVDLDRLQSPIGSPTTMVYADELSVAAIVAAVRAGRTVVKLEGPIRDDGNDRWLFSAPNGVDGVCS